MLLLFDRDGAKTPRPAGYIYGEQKLTEGSSMNNIIIAYGLLEEQRILLESALSEEYDISTLDCITDLIVTDAVCTVINAEKLSEAGMRTLLAYYMDVGDRLVETVVWLGNVELPDLSSFVRCDSFLVFLTELDGILARAQARYDTMQMYGGEYAYLPKHAIEESIEADIHTALQRKYGTNPDPLIVKRMRQELTALREVDASQNALQDLAAVYELSRWLKAQNIPFFVEHVTASGLIPYLLGITHTNPLPPHTVCPECKKLHWNHAYKDGFDIPAAVCPDCGTDLIRDGHNLVWQEFCGYGPIPTYGFWLPASTQEHISHWVENHWRKQDWETTWGAVQRENSRIDVGPFYFIFALDETEIKPGFHHRTVTAEQTGELIRSVGSKWQNYDGIGMPYPKNAAEALAVYELMKDSGARNKCAKYLLHCGLGISDLICCREDIFYYLRDHGFTEKDAIRGMHRVRKGKGFPVITEEMRNARDKWVLTQCADASHLPSKAADWERLLFQIRSDWAPPVYSGLSTGIDVLDNSILGMQPGEVILVGARPAMGKTSFARGVENYLTEQGKWVYYFDFIFDGKDVHREFAEFESELRASNADLAVFDHFQFLSDYDETDETAERLFKKIKSLALELQIPIMVLLHLNKNPETRPDPSPVTTDIPHAERIRPFVDTVLLLYRRAYYDPLVDRSTARCIIDKAKRCHCKVLSLRWDDENYKFTD